MGVLLILVPNMHNRLRGSLARLVSLGFLVVIVIFVKLVESYYQEKGWYNPMFSPPQDYVSGPYTLDQGNNI